MIYSLFAVLALLSVSVFAQHPTDITTLIAGDQGTALGYSTTPPSLIFANSEGDLSNKFKAAVFKIVGADILNPDRSKNRTFVFQGVNNANFREDWQDLQNPDIVGNENSINIAFLFRDSTHDEEMTWNFEFRAITSDIQVDTVNGWTQLDSGLWYNWDDQTVSTEAQSNSTSRTVKGGWLKFNAQALLNDTITYPGQTMELRLEVPVNIPKSFNDAVKSGISVSNTDIPSSAEDMYQITRDPVTNQITKILVDFIFKLEIDFSVNYAFDCLPCTADAPECNSITCLPPGQCPTQTTCTAPGEILCPSGATCADFLGNCTELDKYPPSKSGQGSMDIDDENADTESITIVLAFEQLGGGRCAYNYDPDIEVTPGQFGTGFSVLDLTIMLACLILICICGYVLCCCFCCSCCPLSRKKKNDDYELQ